MQHVSVCFPILGVDLVADVYYRVTSRGCPEQGPTYDSGGQPAEAPEWEIDRILVGPDDGVQDKEPFSIPAWLHDLIAESDETAQAIIEDMAELATEDR